jgi:hypothetical protein
MEKQRWRRPDNTAGDKASKWYAQIATMDQVEELVTEMD